MDEAEVLETRRFFSNVALWPQQPGGIDPEGWLDNFSDPRDRRIALALLDSFVYLNAAQMRKMVESAFHALSARVESERSEPGAIIGQAWGEFRSKVVVSYPAGAAQDPAASGRLFIRAARGALVPNETQLYDPLDLVREAANRSDLDVVYVDDFSGTGNQFLETWLRQVTLANGRKVSMKLLAKEGRLRSVTYAPALSTATGKRFIQDMAPEVSVRPAHILPSQYSAEAHDTALVPPEMQPELDGFLRRYAARAGYDMDAAYGYGRLGLAISFEHSTPDSTLPIYWSTSNGWRPLRAKP